MSQSAHLQQKPIQKQRQRESLLKEPRPFRRKPFLKTSMTLSLPPDSLPEVSLAAQTPWTPCRGGARRAWSPTSTPPPMPTSRCSPPSAELPPLPTSRQRSPGRSRARQRLRQPVPISKPLMNTGTTDLPAQNPKSLFQICRNIQNHCFKK